jgi:hypothetical protein
MTNLFQLLLNKINVLEERITAQEQIIEQLQERNQYEQERELDTDNIYYISDSSSNDSLFSYI